jgi:hypothetical protein
MEHQGFPAPVPGHGRPRQESRVPLIQPFVFQSRPPRQWCDAQAGRYSPNGAFTGRTTDGTGKHVIHLVVFAAPLGSEIAVVVHAVLFIADWQDEGPCLRFATASAKTLSQRFRDNFGFLANFPAAKFLESTLHFKRRSTLSMQ